MLCGDPREHRWKAAVKPEGLTVGLIQSVASPTGFATRWRYVLLG